MADETVTHGQSDGQDDPYENDENYAHDVRLPRPRVGHRLLLLACAGFIGFLGARSVAETAGCISLENAGQGFRRIHGDEGTMIFLSGTMLALFVFAVFRFIFGIATQVIALLARLQPRPPTWVAIVILACGVLCLLAAVLLQWHAASASANVAFDMPGMPRNGMQGGGIFIQAQTSPMVPITTLGVLLAGVALLAVGIWSSIPPRLSKIAPLASRAP